MPERPITLKDATRLCAPLLRFSRVALAVSGGPDSLALMHLAARWRARRKTGPEIVVLTVDHGLRADARAEALTVRRLARACGLRCAILTWDGDNRSPGTAIQARARAARYDLMAGYCHRHGIPALVTAHHLDDQAETFLMRLKRGSGLDGLSAIPAEGSWAGLTLLRPLLDVPKARLVATAERAGLPFAADPSNADPAFERARLRGAGEAMAMLGLSPEAIARSAARLRRVRAALDHATGSFLANHAKASAAGYAVLDLEALTRAPDDIGLRALSRLLAAVGGASEPIRLSKLEALLEALKAAPGTARSLGRCRIVPKSGQLAIFREMRRSGLPALTIGPGQRSLWDNRFQVSLGRGAARPVTVKALGEEGVRTLRAREALSAAIPRLAAVALPACWRGTRLLCVPDFGQDDAGRAPLSRHEAGIDCQARFLRDDI